jgi:hypothetical protein
MIATPWLVETLQREQEREMEADQLARFAARIRVCCNPSVLTRLARALRGQPVAC